MFWHIDPITLRWLFWTFVAAMILLVLAVALFLSGAFRQDKRQR